MKVVLNQAQRSSLSWLFDPNNCDGEPFDEEQGIEFTEEAGQLGVNGAFLHTDGEWGTYAEPDEVVNPGVPPSVVQPTREGMLNLERCTCNTKSLVRTDHHSTCPLHPRYTFDAS